MTLIEFQIPFSGFYSSIHDQEIDRIWERECEYFAEETGENMPEWACDIIWQNSNYPVIWENYARAYSKSFFEWMEFENAEFVIMTRPKYYNFETDRLFGKFSRSDFAKVIKYVRGENEWGNFVKHVKEKFTARDGYIPHYERELSEWGKPSEWDYNQIGVLVEFAAHIRADSEFCTGAGFDSYAEYMLIEDLSGNGDLDNWFWSQSEEITRLANALHYMRERAKRPVKTMAQWHAARRAEMRPFEGTPLGAYAAQESR